MKSPQAMRQQQLLLVVAGSLLVTLLLSLLTEAQTVLGHPYRANTRHELTCERGPQCMWTVQRGGPNNSFVPVRLDANVREGSFPVDLNISLNEETKGIYRCECRRDEREKYELQKEVYFYSAGKWAGVKSTGSCDKFGVFSMLLLLLSYSYLRCRSTLYTPQ